MKLQKSGPLNWTEPTEEALPICSTLLRAAEQEQYGFHMPGHNAGHAFSAEFKKYWPLFDTTELPQTCDLNDPDSAVIESQCRTARFFGARESLYLTGGSTSGIYTMLALAVGRAEPCR